MSIPTLPSNKGKKGMLKFPPDGARKRFEIIDEIQREQHDNAKKIIVLQRLKFDDDREEIRLGYYILGKKPRMKDRWVWGQYATVMPAEDFANLIREAQDQGWFESNC